MRIDVAFDDSDRELLKQALHAHGELGPDKVDEQVDRLAGTITKAGARELLDQATGKLVPSTVTEYRHHRVYNLLCNGMSVEDAEPWIATLFKISASSAKSLLRATFARFSMELEGKLLAAVEVALLRWRYSPDRDYRDITIASRLVSDWVTDAARLAGKPSPRRTELASQWRFSVETHEHLLDLLGISDEKRASVKEERDAESAG
ncbi:hypothetical protein QCN29_36125 [Streptomyces sp. HNM0663]|uniref:Uncharacterized protein n=1 Tax=Streptomyces chengmaiensis TaxID=3040919 RepID=A0ABT6HZC7_9ACTN|nr:hypothetical protein [Streptomyces chengmaiensis]MDH2394076.1 hypothetical protein [Streptomyces chengmaiensis]